MVDRGGRSRRSLAASLKRQLIVIVSLTLFLILIFLLRYRGFIGNPLCFVLLGLITILYLITLFFVINHVYSPIKKVEDLTEVLTRGDKNLFQALDLESDGAELSMNFQELVHLLKDSVDREISADILKKEAELKALQSQINPHFLYNVLDGIRGHALAEGVVDLAEMTEALSKIFRYSVSHWENEVSLESELTNVKSYFKIQQYRFDNRFELQVLIEGDEDAALACRLPKLTLQPIIENSIYHGLETKLTKGFITIRTRLSDDLLLIEIADDGVGISRDTLEVLNRSFNDWKTVRTEKSRSTGSGIALANVNSRIKMMYGEVFGLHVYSTEDFGAMVEILLPRNHTMSGNSSEWKS